jgi:DNA-binding NarL/FixJ family response regulator
MPAVGGRELCTKIREIRPELPLIVMSGYVTEDERWALSELGVYGILPKPFRPQDLEQIIEGALHE